MASLGRMAQDRRKLSRVIVRQNCSFNYEGATYEAVMVDLSLKGAFLSAAFLPPNGATIRITLDPPGGQKPLVLDGRVVRGTWVMSDHGRRGRFGIVFTSTPIGITRLISSAQG